MISIFISIISFSLTTLINTKIHHESHNGNKMIHKYGTLTYKQLTFLFIFTYFIINYTLILCVKLVVYLYLKVLSKLNPSTAVNPNSLSHVFTTNYTEFYNTKRRVLPIHVSILRSRSHGCIPEWH